MKVTGLLFLVCPISWVKCFPLKLFRQSLALLIAIFPNELNRSRIGWVCLATRVIPRRLVDVLHLRRE